MYVSQYGEGERERETDRERQTDIKRKQENERDRRIKSRWKKKENGRPKQIENEKQDNKWETERKKERQREREKERERKIERKHYFIMRFKMLQMKPWNLYLFKNVFQLSLLAVLTRHSQHRSKSFTGINQVHIPPLSMSSKTQKTGYMQSQHYRYCALQTDKNTHPIGS